MRGNGYAGRGHGLAPRQRARLLLLLVDLRSRAVDLDARLLLARLLVEPIAQCARLAHQLGRRGLAQLRPISEAEIRALQLKGIELVHAWLDAAPTGVNGAKAFQNMAGVPVGDARLPSLPVGDGAEI